MSRIYAPSEAELQSQVVELAHMNGWMHHHHYDSRRSVPGWPDLVLVRPATATVLFIELKTDSGKVTTEQRAWLEALNACGLDARVWRPCDFETEIVPTLSRKRASR